MHCKELALLVGRKWQSEQTGFVHYCYHSSVYDTIPTKENAYFILALFRSRNSENIQEGKKLLERLLCYQVEGNFPIYLHEFPTCYRRWQSADLLAPLYWILKTFHPVIGKELKENLQICLRKLIAHSLDALKSNKAEYITELRIACGAKALGRYFSDVELEEKGDAILASLQELKEQKSWYSSESMGHMLASLNMVEMWPEFWSHCQHYYNEATATYSGPWYDEHLRGKSLQATLYDLYLSKDLPKRCQQLHPTLLSAALVHPFVCETKSVEIDEENVWDRVISSQFACTLIEQNEKLTSVEKKGFHPLAIQFGDRDFPASFVAQGGNITKTCYRVDDQKIDMLFNLGEESENDNPVENREISFFCTQEGAKFSLHDKGMTVFRLGDRVQLSGTLNLFMTFELAEGEGDFLGHLAIENRPSQLEGGKKDAVKAYDWHLFIRSIRRTPNCKIRVIFEYA